jgi:hypothetical protein
MCETHVMMVIKMMTFKFHHNEKQFHIMCVTNVMMQTRRNNIGNKNELLCMNVYTYVMTFIMDKM